MYNGKEGQTKYWIVKNAWGETFGDKGTFLVQMESFHFNFIDVFYTINGLTEKDRKIYEHFLSLTQLQIA